MAHQQQNTTGHPGNDSFFNRVFGHHSPHDTPRSRTPTSHLTAPRPTKTSSTRSSSRHSRNSSVGTLQTTSPTVSDLSIGRRRRSFDGRESIETTTEKAASQRLGAPLRLQTSVSSNTPRRSNDRYPHKSYRERKGSAQGSLSFPRSDRESSLGSDSDSTRRPELRRRNSGEPQKHHYQALGTAPPPPTTTKKRHFLGRFGKRKTGNSTDSNSPRQTRADFDASSSTTSLASSIPSSTSNLCASTAPSITSSIPSNNRKKSGDNGYRMVPAHPLDLAFTDGHMRYPQPFHIPVHPTERRKDQSHYNRKGRDKERNDMNYRDHHGGKPNSMKDIELDQNFGSMDGIVNLDYYSMLNPSSANSKRTGFDRRGSETAAEQWAPPDSWGVQLPVLQDGGNNVIGTQPVADDESALFDEYAIEEQEKWDVPKKNFCVRIFRPDGTFATVQVPLNITTVELLNKLAGKFFLPDMSKYNLMICRQNQERILHANERPIHIQKMLLEQMGYTEEDRIEELGLEDNSYLLRFSFGPNIAQMLHEDPEIVISRDVDLQGRNLPTIPIFLYKYASQITSLDLSRNLLMEIPVDFAQMCRSLRHLSFADNEYPSVPISIRHISSLESLDMSGNRIKDVQQAHLEDLSELQILKAYNNRLETLPTSFAAFENLTILLLSNNSFTSFPDVICQIVCLSHLDISFNKISALPDEIGNLTNLVHFYAIANRLAGALPPSFARLAKLEKLDIRQNLISNFDVLSELESLQVLLADFNSTSEISCDFRNLQRLDMYKNHLTHFNISPSRSPCNLRELNLSNCKLSSLPDDMFLSTACLEIVVLDCNTLTALPSSIGQLKKLERLSVQANNLETLPEEIAKLSDLKTLDVQKNNLKTLPKEIWLCSSLQTLNCSSNLLESFPQPYSAPGIALHLPLASAENENVVAPSVVTNVLDSGMTTHLGATNAGQGIVPTTKTHDLAGDLSVRTPQAMPNFNPPSFFASPRNHPPPLSLSLRNLFLGDNRLTDEVWAPLSWFIELRILNLSFNYLTEMLPEGFFHQHLLELYISGNHLTSLPADDIEKLSYLRVLAVNGNKLQTIPAEIGKLRRLVVLDVGNNTLKYNISNWPYDWNWNWNLGLKYLNLSGNKRLEIKKTHPDHNHYKEKDLSDFSALTRLRMLGLMDITMLGVSVLEEYHDRRIRTSPSEVNGMSYGVADWLGPNDHLATWDLVMPRFGNKDDESIFGLFDGRKQSKAGCKLTKFLYDNFTYYFMNELRRNKQDDTIVSAIRRTFLSLEKGLATSLDEVDSGASAVICYIAGHKLHVANVGDAIAVISRNNGHASEITQKHIPLNPSESSRIRAAGGFVSNDGRLNGELQVSRSFGHFHLIPALNANPYVSTIMLTEDDEFVIMASRGLWDHMSYQTAVDIARTEKDDMMAAAQKLRDFAITYGAQSNLMVMVIKISDIFDKRDKQHRTMRGNLSAGRGNQGSAVMVMDDKYKRRGIDESPGDSTLARLDREVPPPTNQVALVFTDIKSSTHFWETQPESMRAAIKIHDAVMRRTLRSVGGYEVKTEGDAFMVCFQNVTAALLWCFRVQLQLLQVDWPAGILDTEDGREIEKDNVVIYKGLSVRMGIHWGMPVFERNPITNRMDYFGPVVNKASRICNAADGGQICVSSDVVAALRNFYGVFDNEESAADQTPASLATAAVDNSIIRETQQLKRLGFHIVELGERRLKGLETPEMLSLVYPKQLVGRIELDKMASTTVPPVIKPAIESTAPIPHPPLPSESRSVAPVRTIDPSLICALSDLAIRLERITAGSLQKRRAESPEGVVTASTGLGRWLDKHMRETASDEELMAFMENFVARVENAVSTLYLQKVGRFASVLEKLGEAIEVDPMHVLRALQMYSEVAGLDNY